MTGKAYYITTLANWHRHAARFANSHFIVLGAPMSPSAPSDDRHSERSAPVSSSVFAGSANTPAHAVEEPLLDVTRGNDSLRILVLIEADEGVHLSLDDDPAFEPLPHPLAQKPISAAAQSALAAHGVPPAATTFDAAEALARVHPLLRHRVF